MEDNAPKRTAKEQFDKQAAEYNAQWNIWSEETLNDMVAAAQPKLTDALLDVATGTGFTALAFAPHVRSVIGLNVSPEMLAQARNYAVERGITNAAFKEGTPEALPFADGAFDLVTCRIAPQHFSDVQKFLLEAARVLKPRGRFVFAGTTVPDALPDAARWQNAVQALRDLSYLQNYTPLEWWNGTEAAELFITQSRTSGSGIAVPLSDWLHTAGCTPEQSVAIRQAFADAESARQTFQIVTDIDETVFTWHRKVTKAIK